MSTLYFIFGQPKIEILKSILFFGKKVKIDLRGNSIIKSKDTIFNFQWGFKSAYRNNIEIIGTKGIVNCEFFFAKKINQSCNINIKINNKTQSIKTSSGNQINEAFNNYLKNSKKMQRYLNNVSLYLAKLTDKIRKDSLKINL